MRVGPAFMAAIAVLRGPRGDLAVLVAVLVVLVAAWVRHDRVEGLVLAPAEISIGTVAEGEERTVTLTLSNHGGRAATCAVVPSCTCVSAHEGPLVVAARSSVSFDVRVSTAGRPGFNVAHVQITGDGGASIGQAAIAFTAVEHLVFDPPVLFLRGGDGDAATRAYSLAPSPPDELRAVTDDPAVSVAVVRRGRRSWDLEARLDGVPRGRTATISVRERRGADEQAAGAVTMSLPTARLGDVRLSPVAERVGGDRCRAWMLVETEAFCDARVVSLVLDDGASVDWCATTGTGEGGTHLWIEVVYPAARAGRVADADLVVGRVRERVRATLPRAAS